MFGVLLLVALAGAVASLGAAHDEPSHSPARQTSADLVLFRLSNPPRSRPAGATFEVKVYVRNKGNRTAPRSSVAFYLSRDTKRGNDIKLSGQATIKWLKPAHTYTTVTSVRMPIATPPGSWRLLGCAGTSGKSRERNERNNCRVAARAILVTPPPPRCKQRLTTNRWSSSEETIEKLPASIPEARFDARINGTSIGATKLLAFENRLGNSNDFPQALVIYSSGYLRLRPAADPGPSFGQSLVLGPAIWGTSPLFPAITFFSNPQIQRVDVDTSALDTACHGALRIHIVANDEGLPASAPTTNQIMNLAWDIILKEPTQQETEIQVSGTFAFTQQVTPDPTRTSEFQSFKLFQISSMYIDADHHDVDGFRYRDASGPITVSYNPGLLGQLVPATPTAIDPQTPVLDSFQSAAALPNGKTPSYRITLGATSGPMAPPTTPRAWLTPTTDVNQDNLGLWLYERPLDVIPAGSAGEIQFTLDASGQSLPPF